MDSARPGRAWLDRTGICDGNLSCRVGKGGRVGERLHPGQVPRIFKAMAREAGLPEAVAGGLSGHSARVGAAQDMVAASIELPAILMAGRSAGHRSVLTILRAMARVDVRTTGGEIACFQPRLMDRQAPVRRDGRPDRPA